MNKENIIVGIDVGTTKIVVAIAENEKKVIKAVETEILFILALK